MAVRFFIVDLDGTLVDSAPDIARALNATLAEAGFPPLSLAEVTGRIGDGATKLVERALPPHALANVDVAAMTQRFRAQYGRAVCVDSRAYDGLQPALAEVTGRGVRLGVFTNKPGDLARRLLAALGLDGFVSDVVGDGDGFPRKPAPDGALAMLARAGTNAEHAWVIGDGLPDLRLGRALGCRVAGVSWGYTPRAVLEAERPDRILDRPEQLATLLEAAAAGG
jgi:phosphoglycolate phosphatase